MTVIDLIVTMTFTYLLYKRATRGGVLGLILAFVAGWTLAQVVIGFLPVGQLAILGTKVPGAGTLLKLLQTKVLER